MKGRNQKCIKGFVNSKNAYMLVYTQATDDIQPHVSVTSVVSNSQGSSKSNGVERSGVNSSALEVAMEVHGLAVRLRNKVTEQNKKFEEWTSEESNKRVMIILLFTVFTLSALYLTGSCKFQFPLC